MNVNSENIGLIQDSGARSADLPQSQGELVKRKVYLGRFYVLMVLSFVAIQQNVAWLTFGTIPNESFTHFKLSNEEITLLAGKCKHFKYLFSVYQCV